MSHAKKSSNSPQHPSWINMIKECITTYADPHCRGVSRRQIKKYVKETYDIKMIPAQVTQLSKAITLGEADGTFFLPKGPCGTVELNPADALNKMKFRNEKHAINLSHAKVFISLLQDIRNHLLLSLSMRSIYVGMAKKNFFALPPDVRATFAEPTDADFCSYVRSNWPTFRAFINTSKELKWGWVAKQGAQKTNEINILSDLVISVELSAKPKAKPVRSRCLSTVLYKLILTVVVFHELSHAFMNFFFHEIVTPIGVGVGRDPWLVEDQIMGGRLRVEWADERDMGDMDRIDHVLLTKGPNCWKLDVDIAKTSLSSLLLAEFAQPAQENMKHVPDSIRARSVSVTETSDLPISGPSIGLGIHFPGPFGSYVGDDRRPDDLEVMNNETLSTI